MSDRTEFDDLARRKLEEREFPFDEAAWHDMQRMLPERRRSRRGWIVGGVLLLLITTVVLWPEGTEAPTTIERTATENSAVGPRPSTTKAIASNATEGSTEQEARPLPNATTDEGSAAAARTGTVPDAAEERTVSRPAEVKPLRSSTTARPSAVPAAAHRERREQAPQHLDIVDRAPRAEHGHTPIPGGSAVAQPVADRTEGQDTATSASLGTSAATDDATRTTSPENLNEGNMRSAESTAPTGDATHTISEQGSTITSLPPIDPPAPSTADEENASSMAVAAATANEGTSVPSAFNDTTATATHADTTASRQESVLADSLTATTTPLQDSTGTSGAPPQWPTLADPRARWEISALGGPFLTNVRYAGDRAQAWEADVRGRWAASVGAELMHMGPHLCVGIGLHYGQYAERIEARSLSRTFTSVRDTNYFVPVDTMILVILGMQHVNGHDYYVVDMRDTTIHIIQPSTVSSTVTEQRRAALQRVNTWSYLELPLLFDAHVRQGRWSLGLRGGPMLCMLQGRRGVLPNALLDGYTTLGDEAFREISFGYTARLYARYRLSEMWSLGIEPGLKGQLPMDLGGQGLSRQATAVGGQFSVTYRLP